MMPDPTPDPQVPELAPCPRCDGEGGFWVDEEHGPTYHFPCPQCRCEVCGDTTETAPLCKACDERQSRD